MNAAGVAVAWFGSVLGPLFIFSTFGDFSHANTYIGIALLIIVFLSIRDGLKARKHGKMSDFVAMSIVPIAAPIISVLLFIHLWN